MINSVQILLGQQATTDGASADGTYGPNDVVGLLGSTDVLTGGDENFTVAGITSNSVVTLGNGANAVGLIGDNNIVTLGAIQTQATTGTSGASLVASLIGIGGTADLVALVGTGNSLSVAGAVDALLIGTNNSMRFRDPSLASATSASPAAGLVNIALAGTGDHIAEAAQGASGAASPLANIWGGSGSNYVDVASNANITLGGKQNTIIVGDGTTSGSHFDITAGSGQDYVTLQNSLDQNGNLVASSDVVRLAGQFNQVSGGSNATILGGSGDATLTLGTPASAAPGVFNVALGGTGNSVTLQNSVALGLDAGSGSDTVSLLNSSGNLAFHGAGNMLFIGSAAGSTSTPGPVLVNDQSSGLQIDISSSLSSPLTLIGADKSLLIDFAPGASSLTAAQITTHLHSDGAGGTILSAGASANSPVLIHFVGNTHISAASFSFG